LISRDKNGQVSINTSAPVASIRYTLDGTEPTIKSPAYTKSFLLTNGGIIKARGFETGNKTGEISTKEFNLSKLDWRIIHTSPQSVNDPSKAIDEDVNTFWDALQKDSTQADKYPQDISIDMGTVQNIKAFTYLPRQDKKTEGIADKYAFYVSTDGTNWEQVATGEFSNIKSNPVEQIIQPVHTISARYFKFAILHVVSGKGVAVAELGVKVN
jgi:alpha-L-fucosidase